MRKRTVRSGMRMLLAALLLIIMASFYHIGIADFFSFSAGMEQKLYGWVIFVAAVIGGYGVALAVLGLVLSSGNRETGVRLLPILLIIIGTIGLFFYLFAASFDRPMERERLRPGETITI